MNHINKKRFTYGELEKALAKLGFVRKSGRKTDAMAHEPTKTVILMPLHFKGNEEVLSTDFRAAADMLEWKEILPHWNDLAEMILAERATRQKQAA